MNKISVISKKIITAMISCGLLALIVKLKEHIFDSLKYECKFSFYERLNILINSRSNTTSPWIIVPYRAEYDFYLFAPMFVILLSCLLIKKENIYDKKFYSLLLSIIFGLILHISLMGIVFKYYLFYCYADVEKLIFFDYLVLFSAPLSLILGDIILGHLINLISDFKKNFAIYLRAVMYSFIYGLITYLFLWELFVYLPFDVFQYVLPGIFFISNNELFSMSYYHKEFLISDDYISYGEYLHTFSSSLIGFMIANKKNNLIFFTYGFMAGFFIYMTLIAIFVNFFEVHVGTYNAAVLFEYLRCLLNPAFNIFGVWLICKTHPILIKRYPNINKCMSFSSIIILILMFYLSS